MAPNPGQLEEQQVSSQLVGVAGVHYVAACLSFLGFHAVPTTRNVQGPDLLVSNIDGSKSVSLQVKTSKWAMRERGRGDQKKPHHYEWDIGWGSAHRDFSDLYFALVDLKGGFENPPDVFIVPSRVIAKYFDGGNPENWPRARYHPEIEEIKRYMNNWALLKTALYET